MTPAVTPTRAFGRTSAQRSFIWDAQTGVSRRQPPHPGRTLFTAARPHNAIPSLQSDDNALNNADQKDRTHGTVSSTY